MEDNTHKKWYAMMNWYATETSCGFANTWYAVSFYTRKERDQAIKEGIQAARLPLRCEKKYCNENHARPGNEFQGAVERWSK